MSIDKDMSKSKNTLKENQIQAEIRFLLCLWDLGVANKEVKRGVLNKRIVRKHEKSTDYEKIISSLEKEGAIAISKNSFSLLAPKGLEVLGEGLKSPEFRFEGTIVGTWVANALLKWIGQMTSVVENTSTLVNGAKSSIASYDEFKPIALEIYGKLNHNYNLDDLVPIYRIRREIGESITQEHFKKWMLEMQKNDIFQFMAGEMPDITPDKREDSISIPGGGLRYYAKLLNS